MRPLVDTIYADPSEATYRQKWSRCHVSENTEYTMGLVQHTLAHVVFVVTCALGPQSSHPTTHLAFGYGNLRSVLWATSSQADRVLPCSSSHTFHPSLHSSSGSSELSLEKYVILSTFHFRILDWDVLANRLLFVLTRRDVPPDWTYTTKCILARFQSAQPLHRRTSDSPRALHVVFWAPLCYVGYHLFLQTSHCSISLPCHGLEALDHYPVCALHSQIIVAC